jgi:hypothetical protein
MSQIDRHYVFPKWVNCVPLALVILGLLVAGGAHVVFGVFANPGFYETSYRPEQPIPYSHRLPAGQLGLDCLYCHTGAEKSSVAGVPATAVCMKCHKSVKKDSPKLAALRKSVETGQGLEWVRLHRLPDYVHFNHKSHVQVGLACQECHGPVERMERLQVQAPMSMGWCLNCHRKPRGVPQKIQTRDFIKWETAETRDKTVFKSGQRKMPLSPPTNCSGCHQ